MKKLERNLGLSIAVALSLSACASMNNGVAVGDTGGVVAEYPVETAMLNIYTKARNQTLQAKVGNQMATADIQVTPKGNMRFNNKLVQGSEINTINKVDDQITDQSVAINYFTLNPLVFYGFTDSTGKYSLSNQVTTIPKTARVGDSSQLIVENVYSDSSRRKKIATYNQDWSLSQDSNNTAWLCIETSENLLLSNIAKGTTSECYKINARGDILASKVTINQPTPSGIKTVTFTSQ